MIETLLRPNLLGHTISLEERMFYSVNQVDPKLCGIFCKIVYMR